MPQDEFLYMAALNSDLKVSSDGILASLQNSTFCYTISLCIVLQVRIVRVYECRLKRLSIFLYLKTLNSQIQQIECLNWS